MLYSSRRASKSKRGRAILLQLREFFPHIIRIAVGQNHLYSYRRLGLPEVSCLLQGARTPIHSRILN